jgi:hypothetical protein
VGTLPDALLKITDTVERKGEFGFDALSLHHGNEFAIFCRRAPRAPQSSVSSPRPGSMKLAPFASSPILLIGTASRSEIRLRRRRQIPRGLRGVLFRFDRRRRWSWIIRVCGGAIASLPNGEADDRANRKQDFNSAAHGWEHPGQLTITKKQATNKTTITSTRTSDELFLFGSSFTCCSDGWRNAAVNQSHPICSSAHR